MSTPRNFVMLGVISIATLQTITSGADAAKLSLVGSSTKVCQLVGETDWATGNPTAARTLSNFGLDAVDLGFPVDSGPPGPLYFLFGDALPPGHPPTAYSRCRRTMRLAQRRGRPRRIVQPASIFNSSPRRRKRSPIQRFSPRSSRERSTCRLAACF